MSSRERADAASGMSAITVRRVLRLATGEHVDARITVHVAERFIERVRWASAPQHAAVELGRLLPNATLYDRRPAELRSSPFSSDFYIRLGDWWMPAVRHDRDRNLIVITTIFDPSDLRRQQTKVRLDRKRRKERNAARRDTERRQRPSRRR
jgi:hypothetical protein